MLERTYEYRLYPTPEQIKKFSLIAYSTQALYNRMLDDRTTHFRKTGTWKRLDPDVFVRESLILRDLDPSIINRTVARLDGAYRNFFRIQNTRLDRYRDDALAKQKADPTYQLMDTDLVGYPRAKTYSGKESWDIGTGAVLIIVDRVTIPGVGNIKLRLHRPIPGNAQVQYYTVLKKPSGHFFLLVHLLMPEPKQIDQPASAVGVAFAPGKLAQCSNKKRLIFRHETKAQRAKMSAAYEALRRKQPGSNRYEKQRKHLAALYEKRVNQRHDCLHKLAGEVVAKADFIAIEEPRVMRKKKALVKQGAFGTVSDEAWWTFSEYLKYKSAEQGKRLWRPAGALPIRDACSNCGVIIEGVRRGTKWECPFCGLVLSPELNAAINLEKLGQQYIEENNGSDEGN